MPAIANPAGYAFSSPNSGAEAAAERSTALKIASHVPVDRPELAFVYGSAQAALGTLDRVATVATYAPTLTYPNKRTRPGAARRGRRDGQGHRHKVFYVTTGGFDTHSAQNVNATNGAYYNLMATLNDALLAFYNDLKNQGLLDDTLVRQLLGVRPAHHRERQPGHRPWRRRP